MSNLSEFKLQFRHASRERLQEAQAYMHEQWKVAEGGVGLISRAKALLEKMGMRSSGGEERAFNFGEIVSERQVFVLPATTRVNQDLRGLHITGKDGVLADVLSKFPE